MTQVRNPAADGVLEPATGGRVVLRFRRKIAHPPERVWAALTEPAELIGWWGAAEVDLAEGGRFVLRWLNADDSGNRAEMHATITRLDPPRLLETTGDLHGVLRWELQPDGQGRCWRSLAPSACLPSTARWCWPAGTGTWTRWQASWAGRPSISCTSTAGTGYTSATPGREPGRIRSRRRRPPPVPGRAGRAWPGSARRAF